MIIKMRINYNILTLLLLSLTLLIGNDESRIDDPVYEMIKENAIENGVPDYFLREAFQNDAIKIHEIIPKRFATPYEKKSWEEYQKLFVTSKRIEKGKAFFLAHRTTFSNVSETFGVNPYLILSIVGVESNYGSHHKQFSVFNSLYTQISEMPKRSRWAKKELIEFLVYCYNDKLHPHEIYGSYAGAFGYGQFIPSSFNHYAVDFNGDGKRQPYEWTDVVGSVANYLAKNGYPVNKSSLSREDFEKKIYKSVYSYNHSDNYVKAVLKLQEELEKAISLETNNQAD